MEGKLDVKKDDSHIDVILEPLIDDFPARVFLGRFLSFTNASSIITYELIDKIRTESADLVENLESRIHDKEEIPLEDIVRLIKKAMNVAEEVCKAVDTSLDLFRNETHNKCTSDFLRFVQRILADKRHSNATLCQEHHFVKDMLEQIHKLLFLHCKSVQRLYEDEEGNRMEKCSELSLEIREFVTSNHEILLKQREDYNGYIKGKTQIVLQTIMDKFNENIDANLTRVIESRETMSHVGKPSQMMFEDDLMRCQNEVVETISTSLVDADGLCNKLLMEAKAEVEAEQKHRRGTIMTEFKSQEKWSLYFCTMTLRGLAIALAGHLNMLEDLVDVIHDVIRKYNTT